MSRLRPALATALLLAVGCGADRGSAPGQRPNAPIVESCRVLLPPRAAPLDAPSAPSAPSVPSAPPPPRSRIIGHAEIKLAPIAKELEAKVARRLAVERDRNIGVAGQLNYTVDRGPLRLLVEDDALVVQTDVRGHAEACKGGRCYASCEPEGRATATVSFRLTPDYRFPPSRVGFVFTRGCEVRALGGLLKIDVTPTLRAELGPALRRIEQDIDAKLPPLRPEVERAWSELGKTRALPLGGCVVPSPRAIALGPVTPAPDAMRLRFGLTAYPEIRSRCEDAGAGGAPPPLPPLVNDPAMPAEDDLILALIAPLQTALAGLERSDPFDAGAGRARVERVIAAAAGPGAQADLALRGDVCGDAAVRTAFAWTEDGKALRFAKAALVPIDRERAARAGLAPDALGSALDGLRFAPMLPAESLRELAPLVAAQPASAPFDASAKVTSVKPLDVAVRGGDLAATVLVRGSVELRQR